MEPGGLQEDGLDFLRHEPRALLAQLQRGRKIVRELVRVFFMWKHIDIFSEHLKQFRKKEYVQSCTLPQP